MKRFVTSLDKKFTFLLDPLKMIGQGSEGCTYQVDKNRALKIVKDFDATESEKVYAVGKAGKYLPGIAWPSEPVFDSVTNDPVGFLMPFVKGRSLEECLDNRETATFPDVRKIKLALFIASTIERVHELRAPRIVLGDLIKAGNLQVDGDTATFVDALSVSIFGYRTAKGNLTDSISKLSSPGYVPSEVLLNNSVKPSQSADCFALAVLLFQLFFGQLPTEPKPCPDSIGHDCDEAVKLGHYPRYVESTAFEAPKYDSILIPERIDELLRAALLLGNSRPTAKQWVVALKEWLEEVDAEAKLRQERLACILKYSAFSFLVIAKLVVILFFVMTGHFDSPKPTRPVALPPSALTDKLGSNLFKELFR